MTARITLFDGPLVAQIVLKDPATGIVLLELNEVTVEPSDTVSWQYPPDGIEGTIG